MPTPSLRLYNTLTRTKEDFVPIDAGNVRMYVCGPTVYDYAHIGNARPVIVFDVLYRLLRHLYGEQHVTYVRNITDVDDKINARALRDFPNLPLNDAIAKVTASTEKQFHEDVAALGCLPPTDEPHATAHIEQMKEITERLVARGVAYVAQGHVLFSPSAMNALPGAPRYGSLARRSLDEMLAGARVDVAPYKRDPMDFVLWKPSAPEEPGWPSPCGIGGLGRPGWHLECSAMSMAKLLTPFGGGLACDDPQKNVFDIHGGGIDLVFPHHENEIAQSCCAFGSQRMANVWMHNGFLQVEGEKMSKSLGNFVTINELLHTEKFGGRKWPGEVLRLAMLMTDYRQPLDFTADRLREAESHLRTWRSLISDLSLQNFRRPPSEEFLTILSNDLNTPEAIAYLKRTENSARQSDDTTAQFASNIAAIGCLPHSSLQEFADWPSGKLDEVREMVRAIPVFAKVVGERLQSNDFKRGLEDIKSMTAKMLELIRANIEQTKVEALIAARLEARKAKNWAESDRIRDELLAMGIALKDNKDGTTTWEVKR